MQQRKTFPGGKCLREIKNETKEGHENMGEPKVKLELFYTCFCLQCLQGSQEKQSSNLHSGQEWKGVFF